MPIPTDLDIQGSFEAGWGVELPLGSPKAVVQMHGDLELVGHGDEGFELAFVQHCRISKARDLGGCPIRKSFKL